MVSGDWILVAASRSKRPHLVKKSEKKKSGDNKSKCPFEDPQKNGNPFPLLWYPHPKTKMTRMEDFDSWFLQVIPNKYPLLYRDKKCPVVKERSSADALPAVGYHEVIITRDHERSIEKMTTEEVELILKAYKERFRVLSKDPCVKYILIFHNHGEKAGASLYHPHSQLVALPVIDPDVSGSLNGSWNFRKLYKKCVHCFLIEREMKDKKRVVEKNEHFITVVPYASRVSYETRIYPLKHSSRFEDLSKEMFPALAKSLRNAVSRLNKAIPGVNYNFFIHTAPVGDGDWEHYHWHIEIIPRGFSWAGLELGSGIEVVVVSPEEAAAHLREQKIK